MGRVNNTEFLSQVLSLLETNAGKSSVYITQKRLSLPMELNDAPKSDFSSNVVEYPANTPENTEKYPVLVRVSMNTSKDKKSKTKLSTVVEVDQLDLFWNDYTQALKVGFVGLRKKEKKTKKKVTKP